MFNEDGQQQDYSDGENAEHDKRPVSKLHRRDTPHHLKNKRVQQHLTDKAANVILSKLKEMPQPIIDEVSPQVEMNPMPIERELVQDVGLPIIDHYPEMTQNGIDLSGHPGEFHKFPCFPSAPRLSAHKYAMNPRVMLNYEKQSICGANFTQLGIDGERGKKMGFLSARTRCEVFRSLLFFRNYTHSENKWRSLAVIGLITNLI